MTFDDEIDITRAAGRRWNERTDARAAQVETAGRMQARLDRLQEAARSDNYLRVPPDSTPPSAAVLRQIGLESTFGQSDFQNIAFLELALAISRYVGRINIGNGRMFGSGSMVSPRLLLTNNHVLVAPKVALNSTVEFDYQVDRTGRQLQTYPFALRPDLFFLTDKAFDFTLVAVDERSSLDRDLRHYGWTRLIGSLGKIVLKEHVNIVQHPRGGFKQFVTRNNEVVDVLDNYLHYVTDTEPGSSGSPVFNDQWEMVALHHAGVPRMIGDQVASKRAPNVAWDGVNRDDIDWVANEGIRVSKLVDAITAASLEGEAARMRDELLTRDPPNPIDAAQEADEAARGETSVQVSSGTAGGTGTAQAQSGGAVMLTVPLNITIELGQPLAPSSKPSPIVAMTAVTNHSPQPVRDDALPRTSTPHPADAGDSVRVSDLASAVAAINVLDMHNDYATEALAEALGLFGHYIDVEPHVALLDDGRKLKLLTNLIYIEEDGHDWPVPKDWIVDGASIPRVFWSIIGSPLVGKYRNASIIHDYYCDTRSHPWRETHRMFYEAMRCSGTGEAKAKVMYYAVYRFGPRWELAKEAFAEGSGMVARTPVNRDAPTILADAEAIYAHGLNLDEIDNLADARDHAAASVTRTETVGTADRAVIDRARRLVITGGKGTAEDLEAVAREVALLPGFVLNRFERKKVRIVACRGDVTDFERSLRDVTPRGWEGTGHTWNDVPGTYLEKKKRVVVATIAAGSERQVPTLESGKHGSANLTVHESLHGFDYSGNHAVLADADFTGARQRDLKKLGLYERQHGQPGLEETFAESGARFVAEPDVMQSDWPGLFGFWQGFAARTLESGAVTEDACAPVEMPEPDPDAPLGTIVREASGTLHLDLRAEGPGGAIGHAMLTIPPGGKGYSALAKTVGTIVGREETAAADEALFYPLQRPRKR
nr:DUF1353 domain-containing protein [uncultured Novosphingobium sp.]